MKRKKFLAIMAVCCLAGMTACGGNSESSTETSNSSQESNTNTDNDEQANTTKADAVATETAIPETTPSDSTATEAPEEEKEPVGYYLTAQDVNIEMNVAAKEIIDGLGEYSDYFEAKSCAFNGIDRTYIYTDYEVYTYPYNGVDYISGIYLTETAQTNEGLKIGDSYDRMIELYGEDYTEDIGLYTYEKDSTKLDVLIEGDSVISIEYKAIPPKDALVSN